MIRSLFVIISSISLVFIFVLYAFFSKPIKTFADCEKAGYPVTLRYPRMCRAQNKVFTEMLNGGSCNQNGVCSPK